MIHFPWLPEVLFWSFNGLKAMPHNKKRSSGFEERLAVLRQYFPDSDKLVDKALKAYLRKQVAKDDILDALCAAVTGFLEKGQLISMPEMLEIDSYGLPIKMVYYNNPDQ